MSKKSVEKRIARKREQERARRKRERRMKQYRMWGSAIAAVLVVVLLLVFLGPGKKSTKTSAKSSSSPSAQPSPTPSGTPCIGTAPPVAHPKTYKAYPPTVINNSKKYLVTMETTCGTIKMTLVPKLAPKAVNNFVYLAQQKFYDGLTFHRIEEHAPFQLVQGGDPAGNGSGGPGYQFTIEKPTPAANDPYVTKSGTSTTYLAGVFAMANSGGTASNGSQFFIDVSDVTLPPNYTVMGKADATSLAVLKKMIAVPVSGTTPTPPVYIIKVTVQAI